MNNFQLSPEVDSNKIFLVQRSELEGRLDPNTYHPKRIKAIQRVINSQHRIERLGHISSFSHNMVFSISNSDVYVGLENIESNTGIFVKSDKKEHISSAIVFRKGQVLFSKLRPYLNKVFYANFSGICSTEFHVLNCNEVQNKFLAYFLSLKVVVSQTSLLMSGNTLPRLQTKDIKDILIPIPPKEIQEQIIAKMDTAYTAKKEKEAEAQRLLAGIDDYLMGELGIKLPQQQENTLQNRIFTKKFSEISGGRFDAISSYTQVYEKSLLEGKIKAIKLKSIVLNIKTGSTPHNRLEPYVDNGIPFLRNTNISNSFVNLSKIKFIKNELKNELTYSSKDDVIICIAGTVGNSAVNTYDNLSINQNITSLTLDKGKVNPNFLNCYFNTGLSIKLVKRQCSIATILYINNDNLLNLYIPLPPLSKQTEIAEHISQIRNQAKQLQQQAKAGLEQAKTEVETIILGDDANKTYER